MEPWETRARLASKSSTHFSGHSSGTILPAAVQLNDLKHLHVLQCIHADRLYESLSQLNLTIESFCDGGYGTRDDGAFKIFLRSLAPLRKPRITSTHVDPNSGESAWPSLITHAPELRCLEICDHLRDHEGPFMDEQRSFPTFQAFCGLASHLQQLSMPAPAIEKETWKSDLGLDAFLVKSNRNRYTLRARANITLGVSSQHSILAALETACTA
jgi:hypothetical protein